MDNQFNQDVYNQPNDYRRNEETEVMSMGQWILVLIVGVIPCLNIIMFLVWAFGAGNLNRKNFCRAYLIVMLVSAVLSTLFMVTIGFSIFRYL